MGIIDWILLGFLVLFIWFGWRKGFTAAIVQLGGHILTFILVAHYFPLVQLSLMSKFGIGRNWALFWAIILIVVLVAVVIKVVIFILQRVLKVLKLTTANKTAGAGLGLVNGLIVIMIFMVLLDFVPPLSNPLKISDNHRVYAGINLLKEEVFTKLNLTQRMKLLKLPSLKEEETE
ncbi:MAG: CvpA family protein [Candidatus Cloacimonetes bacterium]|nr:CvpA family protein [Candidatus Cloacimonadota bacterium]